MTAPLRPTEAEVEALIREAQARNRRAQGRRRFLAPVCRVLGHRWAVATQTCDRCKATREALALADRLNRL